MSKTNTYLVISNWLQDLLFIHYYLYLVLYVFLYQLYYNGAKIDFFLKTKTGIKSLSSVETASNFQTKLYVLTRSGLVSMPFYITR